MGYADYEFYKNEYYGTAIAENDFPKWSDRASRQIDVLTFRRLLTAYPKDEYTDKQIKLCVCDLAQKMMEIDKYNQSSTLDENGKPQLIKSVSAGSESYTYVTTESKYAELSKDDNKRKQYIKSVVNEYLAYLSDANGVSLLYAGV